MIKKILLIHPYCQETDHIQIPLGLGYLATALRKNQFEVTILDANKERIDAKHLKNKIEEIKPDVVGFQLFTTDLVYVKNGINTVKNYKKDCLTIVGGPHVSAVTKDIFKTLGKNLNFAFCGEAEIGLPMLLKRLNAKKKYFYNIPGLIFSEKGNVKSNQPVFHKNLDDFGIPAWDLFQPQNYPEVQQGAFFKKFPIAPIITTRGCPFLCAFCAGRLTTGTTVRKRSISLVIKEISLLFRDFGIREFLIVDDNFTFDKQYAKEILNEIIKLKLDASFAVPNGVRLDTLDFEILSLMKKAGFHLISVGIESGSDRVLKLMNKNLSTEKIREKINLIKKNGFDCAGFFVLGFPGETENEIKQTINFSLSLGLLRAYFFNFIPLPGTPIVKQLYKDGSLKKNDYNDFRFTYPLYGHNIKVKRLKQLQREGFIRFYFLRPITLLKNLLSIKRPKQFEFILKRAVNWLS